MRQLSLIFSCFFLVIAGISGGILYAYSSWNGTGPLTEETEVIIPSGASLNKIALILQDENVIQNPLEFKIAAHLLNKKQSLKAGEYLFDEGISLIQALTQLDEGKVLHRSITIPEGLTSYQIVSLLNNAPFMEGEITQIPDEGTLLPETYNYSRGDTRAEKIERMQAAMTNAIDELWPGRATDLPFKTKEEALTLASIVEKETGVSGERAKVAGVFINRLRRGIALQTDPTVIYAMTMGKHEDNGQGPIGRRLLRKDLKIDSPYNTYKYPGLPPGPICNPGKDAIAATLNPEEHEYIYFVADGTGGHSFAKTLAEHNQNVAKWRKIRQQQ